MISGRSKMLLARLVAPLTVFGVAAALSGGCGQATNSSKKDVAAADGVGGLTLSWNAYTGAGIEGFNIYGQKKVAGAPSTATGTATATSTGVKLNDTAAPKVDDWKLVGEVVVATKDVDPKSPKVTLSVARFPALKDLVGGSACFRITALTALESDPSNIVCGDVR